MNIYNTRKFMMIIIHETERCEKSCYLLQYLISGILSLCNKIALINTLQHALPKCRIGEYKNGFLVTKKVIEM